MGVSATTRQEYPDGGGCRRRRGSVSSSIRCHRSRRRKSSQPDFESDGTAEIDGFRKSKRGSGGAGTGATGSGSRRLADTQGNQAAEQGPSRLRRGAALSRLPTLAL